MLERYFHLCGWGLLLILMSIVFPPFTMVVLPILSLILVLFGYRGVSNELGEVRIWRNVILSVVFWLFSFAIIVSFVWYFRTFLENIFTRFHYYFDELSSKEGFVEFFSYLSVRALVFIVGYYVFSVLSSFFFYRANKIIAKIVRNDGFRVGGLLILISAISSPLILGMFIYPVGIIVLIVAFFGKYESIRGRKEESEVVVRL